METLDFIFWFRQFVGLAVGLSAGLLHLTGAYVMIGYIASILILSNLYAYKVLNISDDDF